MVAAPRRLRQRARRPSVRRGDEMRAATVQQADKNLAELAKRGETRAGEPGTTVVKEDDAADCAYIINTGELRASRV